jgi:hypothetical protein
MRNSQTQNLEKMPKRLTILQRIAAFAVFLAIFGMFVMLWLSASSFLKTSKIFGICGFKQSHGLPCPGCYFTTSGEFFVQGRVLEAFLVQPAAAIFALIFTIMAIFALLMAVFGVKFRFLERISLSIAVKYAFIVGLILIFGGWAVTMARALSQK